MGPRDCTLCEYLLRPGRQTGGLRPIRCALDGQEALRPEGGACFLVIRVLDLLQTLEPNWRRLAGDYPEWNASPLVRAVLAEALRITSHLVPPEDDLLRTPELTAWPAYVPSGRVAVLAQAVLDRLGRFAEEARRVEALPHDRAERARDYLRDLQWEAPPAPAASL
ncbi:MAG: hypothetical protein HYY85_19780 [Deltaproteobacteria bacterium]|nr:hypothetical protein [Deltaproteobacteria bacterium]